MGKNTPKKNRNDQLAADQKLIDGLEKHASLLTGIVIRGVMMTNADIVAALRARIDDSLASQNTKAAWLAAVAGETARRTSTKGFASGLRQAILVAFADQIDILADFGLTQRKVAVIAPDAMVVRTAKAKATRAARHTMGRVQKSKITGDNPTGEAGTASASTSASASDPEA